MRLNPLGTAAIIWSIVAAPNNDDCGTIGGMKIGRGIQKYSEKKTSRVLL
jgi:hypothetical protein